MDFEDNKVVTLTTVMTETEAAMLVSALAAEDVEATRAGGILTGFRAEAPAIAEIKVRVEDLEKAQIALAKIKTEYAEIDWSQVDVGEPVDGGNETA